MDTLPLPVPKAVPVAKADCTDCALIALTVKYAMLTCTGSSDFAKKHTLQTDATVTSASALV